MGRFFLALALFSSMNFSGQKMLRDFKQTVNYVMYASLLFFVLALSGCATTGAILTNFSEGMKNGSQENQSKTAYCQSYNYGNGAYSVTCN